MRRIANLTPGSTKTDGKDTDTVLSDIQAGYAN